MRQLSGIDANFLNMETPNQFGHVSSLCIYDPGDTPGAAGFEATKANIEARLHLLPVFRRKLAEVPFGLDHPYWIDDDAFDIEFHVRNTAIPAPGDEAQLCETVARLVAKPLDRSHPLWELYVIEGLEGGRIAQLTKIHHATIDGASGVELLSTLLDVDPAGREIEPAPPWTPEPRPTDGDLLARTALSWARRPRRAVRVGVRAVRGLAEATRNPLLAAMVSDPVLSRLPGRGTHYNPDEVPVLPPRAAPRTSFNKSITAHRKLALCSVSLDEAKAVRKAFGTTLNDVVMALCADSLRSYLSARDELPSEALVGFVPVSLRSKDGSDGVGGNRVSGVTANLHTNIEDPVARLQAISASMTAMKELHDALPADVIQEISEFAPPAVMSRAIGLMARLKIADRTNPPFNVTISNVPGPRIPLYNGGALMEHYYPVSTITDGGGMNITVQSYLDRLDFGVITCRELVPEPWRVTDGIVEALATLVKAAA